MGICIPGVITNINPNIHVPQGLVNLFSINWFVNTIGPIATYWALYKIWPDKESLVSASVSGLVVLESADSDGSADLDVESAGKIVTETHVSEKSIVERDDEKSA